MPAFSLPPAESRPAPSPTAGPWETVVTLAQLAGDLASVPFHLVAFLLRRNAHREHFRQALTEETSR